MTISLQWTSGRLAGTLLFLLASLWSLTGSVAWAGQGQGTGTTSLSALEIEMLTYMREEEKLARDVYLYLYDVWGAQIFTSIADSEQQHMDTMKSKIDKYGLPDPALPSLGAFTNQDLQEKYDQLVAKGALSYLDGLYVGATIEEIDMVDIQYAIEVTDHLDIVTAYQNLLEGSKNHLRAYVSALGSQGFVYVPQYISQELFDAIIDQ